MAQLAAAMGGGHAEWERGWLQLVQRDTTDWALCGSCAESCRRYLGSAPQTSPPKPALQTRKFHGQTEEEAMAAARGAGIPADKIRDVKIATKVQTHQSSGTGRDAEAAIKKATAGVPGQAFEVGAAEITGTGQSGTTEIRAQSEALAREQVLAGAPAGAEVDTCECVEPPKNGFLGFGRQPGTWKISWFTSFAARVSYRLPAVAVLTYEA